MSSPVAIGSDALDIDHRKRALIIIATTSSHGHDGNIDGDVAAPADREKIVKRRRSPQGTCTMRIESLYPAVRSGAIPMVDAPCGQ